jgi:AbiV family abortive infection protein
MKVFVDLSPEESEDLDLAIYKNALQLRKDAQFLANGRNSYSSANSLLILSSEEVTKAILVFLHSKNFNVYGLEGARKFFLDHKIRHHIAQMIVIGMAFLKSKENWRVKKSKQNDFRGKRSLAEKVFHGIIGLALAGQPILRSKKSVDDIQQFNLLKIQGLYVDYRNVLVSPQKHITEPIYTRTEELVLEIFRFYKGLRILYHPSLLNRWDDQKVRKLQEDLHLFIDYGLEDFSFKDL